MDPVAELVVGLRQPVVRPSMHGDRHLATRELGCADLTDCRLRQWPQRRHRRIDRDADLDVDVLGAELVVAAIRRAGRLDAEVRQAVRDVREVLVEERCKIQLLHPLGEAHGGRLQSHLANVGFDHRSEPPTLGDAHLRRRKWH